MDIFTINLDSRPDRWNRVMAIQRAHPWARFQRIPAVAIPLYPIAACTASHQLAVFMACVDDMDRITVAEDDLEPTTHFALWPQIVAKAADLGLDYVVGAVATSEDNTPSVFDGSVERGPSRHVVGENGGLVEASNGRGTHLITYFASAFQKVLGFQFGAPIDVCLSMHPELRGGFAFPFVAVQGDGHSDLCDRAYDTPKLYEGAARRWADRLDIRDHEPFMPRLDPNVPRSSGIETVSKITMRDVLCGRRRAHPAFAASSYLEKHPNGE